MTAAIRVGVSGWSYPDWEGIAYPKPKPRDFDPLPYLAAVVDLIEINTTFYHPSSEKNARNWADRVRPFPGFRFTVKLWQRLTHAKSYTDDDLRAARVVPDILREQGLLGAVLLQFPWSFNRTVENRRRLQKLLEALPDLPLAVEVRHSSWDREEVYASLAAKGIAFVNIDQPVIGAAIGPSERVTAPFAYVRLHGRNYEQWTRPEAGRDDRYNYLYPEEELKPWAERVASMAGRTGEVYLAANNHFKAKALVNSIQLQRMLGQKVAIPPSLREAYPLLQGLE